MSRDALIKEVIRQRLPRLAQRLKEASLLEGMPMDVQAELSGDTDMRLFLTGPEVVTGHYGDTETSGAGAISRLLNQISSRKGQSL